MPDVDGYPLHGPYHGAGVRNCHLVSQNDISQGIKGVNIGPATSENVTSISNHTYNATSWHYFEDYYHGASLSANGGEYLDQNNGHEHDNYGYHYHMTVVEDNGSLTAVFPYTFGPTFYGELANSGITTCQ